MSAATSTPAPRPIYVWWLVLCLVGLDYFSTLAYLPSIALAEAGNLAPIARLGVVILTLFAALPVYRSVVRQSPHGKGGTGLLERSVSGWKGKLLILVVLGFIGTDFVITRTLSLSDAATHLVNNPVWREHVTWARENPQAVRTFLP